MFAGLVLIVVLASTWWFLSPTSRFLSGFASLLDDSHIDRNPLRFLSGRPSVNGRYGGRAVELELTLPHEHRFGTIVVSMETRAPKGEPWKDSAETLRYPDIGRATFDLEGRYELILTNDDDRLRATSQGHGMFPGRFDGERWRDTLAKMQVLAEWLEKR